MMPMPPLLMSSLTTSNRVMTSNGHRRRSRSYENDSSYEDDDSYENDDPDETPMDLKILNRLAVFTGRIASFSNRISLFFTRTYLNRQKKHDGKETNKMSKEIEIENENRQNTEQQ